MNETIQILPLKTVHRFQHVKQINDVFVDKAGHIYSTMSMYNMIECSDNYSDTSESLWQFKRDELPKTDADLTVNGCKTFKYKALS